MKKSFWILLLLWCSISLNGQEMRLRLFVGTYTKSCDSKGIYVYDFDPNSAEVQFISSTQNLVNPSYLTLSTDSTRLYCVNEDGAKSSVSTFDLDPKGNLNFIARSDSKGANPCYIINDSNKVITANYSGGSITVFGKNGDGAITEAEQVVQHHGKSLNAERQESAHVHMVQFTPDSKYMVATDLGTDRIYIYNYNKKSRGNSLEIKDSIDVKKGSGPRHLTFSPDGKMVYLLQELDGTVTVFNYQDGQLQKTQEIKIVADDFTGTMGAAAIRVSPDGKYLYTTNRGTANEITCFEVEKKGTLKFKFRIPSLGRGPRDFAMDPTGNFLLVAHQYSDEVVVFAVNKKTGMLTDTRKRINLCSPVCLVFQQL